VIVGVELHPRPVRWLGRSPQRPEQRCRGERDLHLGQPDAEAGVGPDTEGHVGAAPAVLVARRRVAVDVEALRLRKQLTQVVGDAARDQQRLARRDGVAAEAEVADGGAPVEAGHRVHAHCLHRRTVQDVQLAQGGRGGLAGQTVRAANER